MIRIEGPGGTDDTHAWKPPALNGESVYYLGINRNKRSLVIDLRSPSGKSVLHHLLADADVLVENFRVGTMERMGLEPSVLRSRYPRLIYARILGFGSTGAYANLPGYDLIAQAMSGFMHVTGEPQRPGQKVGVAITDVLSGLYLAAGVAAALVERTRTGRGRYLEVSLLDCAIAGLANLSASAAMVHANPTRVGNSHPTISPYELFETADQDIVLAVGNDRQFARLCTQVLGMPGLAVDPRFITNQDRVRNRDTLHAILAREFRQHPAAFWVQACWRSGVPCGPVRDVASAINDPNVRERGMIAKASSPYFGELELVACPIWIDGGRLPVRLPPPAVGEHTEGILTSLYEGEEEARG